ncbi:hypothetical protein S7711_11629, partial [Stachybotrys chartarum IBT 7711]
MGYFM